MKSLTLTPLLGIPLVHAGDNLPDIALSALEAGDIVLEDGDILVIGQKIVSKAEGRMVNLIKISPGEPALQLASQTEKDPRLVELILRESSAVLRTRLGTIIVEHKLGFICANAGIDHSNVAGSGDAESEFVLLLPEDPDRSAQEIRAKLEKHNRQTPRCDDH